MQNQKDPTLPVKIVVFGIFLVIAGMVAYGIHQKNRHAEIQNQLVIEKSRIDIERLQLKKWENGFKTELFGTKPGFDGKGNCKKP